MAAPKRTPRARTVQKAKPAPREPRAQMNIDGDLQTISRAETAPPSITRPALRAALREDDDPRARAAKRAAEIKGTGFVMDEGVDEFRAPPPPEGWNYEWKRKTVIGQEDPAYQVDLARRGWEPVPASRHPDMMPSTGGYDSIERKGMILMERPKEITDEAREIERRKAISQVRAKEAQLSEAPQGQFERDDPRVRPNIKKSFEPVEIPED
jgi:hypothetical protein